MGSGANIKKEIIIIKEHLKQNKKKTPFWEFHVLLCGLILYSSYPYPGK